MSKHDNELKECIDFFCDEDINGTITVELYSWSSDISRKALNNLKNKELLICKKSNIFNKCLEYKASNKLKDMISILKPMGRTQRLKYIREQYKNRLLD